MTPERWQQVERVCQEALDLDPDQRQAFLDRECAGDDALRQEVASLLGLQPEAEGLLETPVWQEAAGAFAGTAGGGQPSRFRPGGRLGPFEIETLLGTGGMGEVYRARDTRLGRTVALKVLPPDAAADPDRQRRLETEARAASALNHPHICALFDIGSDGETSYLVMEYLEGETLAARMARCQAAGESLPSGLPVGEALEYGAQIAEALAAAHHAGVIHRDLKPGNVMLTRDGVKLLDFGLAKLKPGFEGIDAVGDAGERPRTVSGVLMGTVNYMAPERLRGSPADLRSDLFGFGALLYEMLTGRRAFEGSSAVTVIGAILERDPPPLADLQPLAPPALDRLVRSCLAKDPDERWDSALLAAQELRRIAADTGGRTPAQPLPAAPPPPQVPPLAPARPAWRWLPWSVAAAALVVAVAAVSWRPAPAPAGMQRIDLDLGRGFQAHARSGQAVLSPGGDRIVFSGVGAGGAPDLFVRRLDRAGAVPLDTGGGVDPFFSPDGRWLGFFRGDRLWKVSLSGGRPIELCAAPASSARGADWADGGFIVAALDPAAGLVRIPEAGGRPVQVTAPDASRREEFLSWPQVLPGSRSVIFTSRVSGSEADAGTIEAMSLETGRRTTLQREGDFGRYLASGHLVFVRRATLYAAPMDAGRLALIGPPVPVLGPVLVDEERGRLNLSAAITGDVLVLTEEWREAAGGAARQDGDGSGPAVTFLRNFFDELRRLAPAGR